MKLLDLFLLFELFINEYFLFFIFIQLLVFVIFVHMVPNLLPSVEPKILGKLILYFKVVFALTSIPYFYKIVMILLIPAYVFPDTTDPVLYLLDLTLSFFYSFQNFLQLFGQNGLLIQLLVIFVNIDLRINFICGFPQCRLCSPTLFPVEYNIFFLLFLRSLILAGNNQLNLMIVQLKITENVLLKVQKLLELTRHRELYLLSLLVNSLTEVLHLYQILIRVLIVLQSLLQLPYPII